MLKIMKLDLNADLGEGGGNDEQLLSLVTTVNVACGFHAGDAPTMVTTLRRAAALGVWAGAHPGFPDREHFGRREIERSEDDVFADCLYQLGAFVALAKCAGIQPSHIKPHGALYNLACRDERFARPIVRAAETFSLPIVALPGSMLERLSAGRTPFVREGFADRRYRSDGSLVPRSEANAFIHDPQEAVEQAQRLLRDAGIRTLCVHGDNPQAVRFVQELRTAFHKQGITLEAFA